MADSAIDPWTIVEKVVCWEIWQADMTRVILRLDKPTRLDEQPRAELEARAIAAAPAALRLLAQFASVVRTDQLLMLDPDLASVLEPAETLLAGIKRERAHGRHP